MNECIVTMKTCVLVEEKNTALIFQCHVTGQDYFDQMVWNSRQ
jgi:hypothetical protein